MFPARIKQNRPAVPRAPRPSERKNPFEQCRPQSAREVLAPHAPVKTTDAERSAALEDFFHVDSEFAGECEAFARQREFSILYGKTATGDKRVEHANAHLAGEMVVA